MRDYRLNIDLHLHLGHGESFDDESCRHGWYPFEVATDRVVDGDTIGPIGNVGRHFADVCEARSRFLEQLRDVAHGLGGLGGGIAIADELTVQCTPGLAPQVDTIAGAYRHAELAAQILAVFVLLARLEAAQTLVRCAVGACDGHIDFT